MNLPLRWKLMRVTASAEYPLSPHKVRMLVLYRSPKPENPFKDVEIYDDTDLRRTTDAPTDT